MQQLEIMVHISPLRKTSPRAPALALANARLSTASSPLPSVCKLEVSCCHNTVAKEIQQFAYQ